MKNGFSVTVTKSLKAVDIRSGGDFDHCKVLDMRCEAKAQSTPIDEFVLKRLQNHFVGYAQVPLSLKFENSGDETHLYRLIRQEEGDVLIVTDEISQVADFCTRMNIPFKSKDFYVVESGAGDYVRAVSQPYKRLSDVEVHA